MGKQRGGEEMKIQRNREERHQQKAVESCAPQTHTHTKEITR